MGAGANLACKTPFPAALSTSLSLILARPPTTLARPQATKVTAFPPPPPLRRCSLLFSPHPLFTTDPPIRPSLSFSLSPFTLLGLSCFVIIPFASAVFFFFGIKSRSIPPVDVSGALVGQHQKVRVSAVANLCSPPFHPNTATSIDRPTCLFTSVTPSRPSFYRQRQSSTLHIFFLSPVLLDPTGRALVVLHFTGSGGGLVPKSPPNECLTPRDLFLCLRSGQDGRRDRNLTTTNTTSIRPFIPLIAISSLLIK